MTHKMALKVVSYGEVFLANDTDAKLLACHFWCSLQVLLLMKTRCSVSKHGRVQLYVP